MEYKIFGCKVNKYYTDKWLQSEYLKNKKGIFIATCVVTDKAKKKWLKFINSSIKELKQDEKIYLSGCGSIKKGQIQEDFYNIYPELIKFKNSIELLEEDPKEDKILKIPQIYTKKFLLIQSGCDSFCSFCLTVFKRGKHFSRTKKEIVNEILEFEKANGKEIVLTGVNLGAWGASNTNNIKGSKFNELLEYILQNTSIPRIRISSLGPEFINEKSLELFRQERIYPHIHYSVQSGSTQILESMRRHYNGEYIENLLEKTKNIKREDNIEISIGADLIVGYPGETQEDFNQTLNLIEKGLITKVHVFPFSAHKIGEQVPAGNFENQIDEKIKIERVKKIETIGEKIRQKFINRNKGKELSVLIEYNKNEDGIIKWKGWTQNYIEVSQDNFKITSGKIKRNNIIKGILI